MRVSASDALTLTLSHREREIQVLQQLSQTVDVGTEWLQR
ncbi:Uncharacterised protein [Enterobacter asburiae]|uniref:Uncharacterized protein n=1 Tax=Enterobacter asburiae TaxID=61645 RepID=A0A376FH44_ENTAS|nr:Uncharacterised protein [Enterobacter asburiae]